MFFYRLKGNTLLSEYKFENLPIISEDEARNESQNLYWLTKFSPKESRGGFFVSHPSLLTIDREDLSLLQAKNERYFNGPQWFVDRILDGKVSSINTEYPDWKNTLELKLPLHWRINVVGLGDVGGILATGLRLLGGNLISEIGIYDIDSNKSRRWFYELNQIMPPNNSEELPKIKELAEKDLFNCDMFVFCVSLGVPPVGQENKDVRMIQFEGNSKIVNLYAKKARECGFKGIFSVVSDPVDLLCKSALIASNLDENGKTDYKGLLPEQIRGFGLGVMNARASFISATELNLSYFVNEGRVFGPHGEGLVVADSILNYNEEKSLILTQKTRDANLEVRKTGFKPYIAPALSSGALSLLAAIKGDWHFSATFIGGVYMGAKNRITPLGVELERLEISEKLFSRILETYEGLKRVLS